VYRDALAVFPDNSEACFRLANIERSRRNLEVAVGCIGARPGCGRALGSTANLGLALEKQGPGEPCRSAPRFGAPESRGDSLQPRDFLTSLGR
jgi:hypothetical protein